MSRSNRPLDLGLLVAALLVPTAALGGVPDRLFDFADSYYLANGVNPAMIAGRRQAVPPRGASSPAPFAFQRPVRALLTLPAHDHSGNRWFFSVMGGGGDSLFTPDAAGRRARQLADASPEYVFPRAGTDPLGLSTRQAVVLDMRHGYFGHNPLGLWLHTFVNYTPAATGTPAGRKELADLAKRNGLDRDGTPVIADLGDIEHLAGLGLVSLQTRPAADPLRYAICPVIADPTNGGVAADQFLAYDTRPDGTPVEPQFVRDFESLRLTGRWAK